MASNQERDESGIVWVVIDGMTEIPPVLVIDKNMSEYAFIFPGMEDGTYYRVDKKKCHFYATLDEAKYHVSDWLEYISRASGLPWKDRMTQQRVLLMQEIRRQRKKGVTLKFLQVRDQFKSRIVSVKIETYKGRYNQDGNLAYKFIEHGRYTEISFKSCKPDELLFRF